MNCFNSTKGPQFASVGEECVEFYAHTENKSGIKEPVFAHLREVARLASEFATAWGAGDEGYVTGMLHDLGKYSTAFQEVLTGDAIRIDHATPGALAALKKYRNRGLAVALAIEGHHDGLQSGEPRGASHRISMKDDVSITGKRFSEKNVDMLLRRLESDGGGLPMLLRSYFEDVFGERISAMLYVRMLFSALTDADFLATEAHFNSSGYEYAYRQNGLKFDSRKCDKAIEGLLKHVEEIRKTSHASDEVKSLRDDLFYTCIKKGNSSQGIFTLAAPTGAGKTLSMLAFALHHVKKHKLDRIIFVLPFLTILDQMVGQFKRVFREIQEDVFILEDHSLSEISDESPSMRRLAENWDAPIVVTTTVKFFESLFADKSTMCRKLHNIARSVILFDEAQTLPTSLAAPTLAVLCELSRKYKCSIVFSTATQPAFNALNRHVEDFISQGWEAEEIVPRNLRLFERARRVEVLWHTEPYSWERLVEEISEYQQVLVIVNLRRHAKEIFQEMKRFGLEGVYHLSTDMCPVHRLDKLAEIHSRLKTDKPCRLVSTQCIEAGVDIDFPVVYRAMAPLEAIVQAAGRCNRNGRGAKGLVHVFLPQPDEEKYPTIDYEHATVEVKLLLNEGDIDICSPDVLRRYYENYFSLVKMRGRSAALRDAIRAYDFPEVARLYKWIPAAGVNVLVPYALREDDFRELCERARNGKIDGQWIREARYLSVNQFIRSDSAIVDYLEPVKDRKRVDTGWFILLNPSAYSDDVGVDLSSEDLYHFYTVEEVNA